MKKLLCLTALFATGFGGMAQAQAYNDSYCREYTQRVRVGGHLQEGYGTACQQPDGSWRIEPPAGSAYIAPQPPTNVTYVAPPPVYGYPEPVYVEPPVRTSIVIGTGRWGHRHYGRDWHGDYGHYRRW